MKKLLPLLLCLCLLIATLTACGDDSKKEDQKDSGKSTVTTTQNDSTATTTPATPTISTTPSTSHADHDHGSTTPSDEQVKYQLYTNADKTYRVVFRDAAGKSVAEFDKIAKLPLKSVVNAEKGIYELGWATGDGPSDFYCVYYNVNTGAVSKLFHAPRGTDGVRIAYGSEDQTKIIVQDVFSSGSYYKEHLLEGAYTAAKNIIIGGSLQVDKKTVVIAYVTDAEGATQHTMIGLYE